MQTMFQCSTAVSLAVGEIIGNVAAPWTFSALISTKRGGEKLVMLDRVSSSISERARFVSRLMENVELETPSTRMAQKALTMSIDKYAEIAGKI